MEKEELHKLMNERHSVRQYKFVPIEDEKVNALKEEVENINKESGLNIQIFFNEPTCFNSIKAHYGKFVGVNNYISLVGNKGDKLDETCGYYGERLVLLIQSLGLNSCWVGLTHGKSMATLNKNEKESCIIAFGYGETQGNPHKSKDILEVSKSDDTMPEWFKDGVNAALLAPTAMNQQKFFFELKFNEVYLTTSFGFYNKVDLGITKYHFEMISGKKVKE